LLDLNDLKNQIYLDKKETGDKQTMVMARTHFSEGTHYGLKTQLMETQFRDTRMTGFSQGN
jgi:hypothetical protein